MQESHWMPPQSAENMPLQQEIDPSHPGVHRFPMGDNNTSAPVPAGERRPPVSSLEDLKGKLVSEAMDPYGCQFLHQKLQERKPEDIQMIFSEAKDRICMLMLNPFGGDILQKLYKVCDEEQMTQLVSSVTADLRLLMAVCLDSQGSESIQEFLGCLMTSKQISHVISFFTYFMVPLVNDQFGSRVIGRCLNMFPGLAEETDPIVDVIADNCLEIANDENGSCLLQVIISKASIPRRGGRHRILLTIMSNACDLSRDQFGNRVVQHVIGLETPYLGVSYIVDRLRGDFTILSMDEYGSIVVKKLMEASEGKFASQITEDIIMGPDFLSVLVDPYGYSVIQSAKTYSKGTVRETLNNLIRQHSDLLDEKRKRNHV